MHIIYIHHICDFTACCMTCKVQKPFGKGLGILFMYLHPNFTNISLKIPQKPEGLRHLPTMSPAKTHTKSHNHLELSVPEARRFTSIGSPGDSTLGSLLVNFLCLDSWECPLDFSPPKKWTKKIVGPVTILDLEYIYTLSGFNQETKTQNN